MLDPLPQGMHDRRVSSAESEARQDWQAYLKQAFTEYTSAKISRIDYMQRVAY